jgi:hypothetical protein
VKGTYRVTGRGCRRGKGRGASARVSRASERVRVWRRGTEIEDIPLYPTAANESQESMERSAKGGQRVRWEEGFP